MILARLTYLDNQTESPQINLGGSGAPIGAPIVSHAAYDEGASYPSRWWLLLKRL